MQVKRRWFDKIVCSVFALSSARFLMYGQLVSGASFVFFSFVHSLVFSQTALFYVVKHVFVFICFFHCLVCFCLYLLQISVRVTTMDAELEFAILPNTTGKQLFDQVCGCGCGKRVYIKGA